MAESEKMAALKKAYAEMILNTAKEAATRIMASEKIAIRCKHDLFATKDEALRLLVRLKQMADAKIIEAELASSRHQSKIDELEAQLHEAEDVIIDLREELNWVRGKLERARSYQTPTSADENARPKSDILKPDFVLQPGTISEAKHKSSSHIILDNKHYDAEQNENPNIAHVGTHSAHNAESASIVVKNKESDRNGFTQRIHALEGNILTGKLSPPREADDYCIVMSDLTIKENNKNDAKFTLPHPKPQYIEAVKGSFAEEFRKRVKFRTVRRRNWFGKPKVKGKSCHSPGVKTYQQTSILCRCKRDLLSRNSMPADHSYALLPIGTNKVDVNKELNEFEEKEECKVRMPDNHSHAMPYQGSCFVEKNIISHQRKRQGEVQTRDPISAPLLSYPEQQPCQPSSTLNSCNTHPFSLHTNTKFGIDRTKMSEDEVKLKLLPRLDPGLTLFKNGADPVFGFTNVKMSVIALNTGIAQNTANKDQELEAVLVKKKRETAANSTLSCYESSSAIIDVPLSFSDLRYYKASKDVMVVEPGLHSDSEDTQVSGELNISAGQSNNNTRLVKYTFQRKRKKEALSSPDQNISVEKSIMNRRDGQEQNNLSDQQKLNIINESSRDCQRLAQGVHQLISLSGK